MRNSPPLLSLIAFGFVLPSCGGINTFVHSSKNSIDRTYFIAPHGDDQGPGTRLRPWRSLSPVQTATNSSQTNRDKTIIILGSGHYQKALRIGSSGSLLIKGSGDIAADLIVEVNENDESVQTTFSDLNLKGSISTTGGQVAIINSKMVCLEQACVNINGSNALFENLSLKSAKPVNNLIRIVNGNVRARKLFLEQGGTQSQILVKDHSSFRAENIIAQGGAGIGLSVVSGSTAQIARSQITKTEKFALHVDEAKLQVSNSTVGDSLDISIGVKNGKLTVTNSKVESSKEGAVHLYKGRLKISKSEIVNDRGYGLIAQDSFVKLNDSLFISPADSSVDDFDDSIFLTGPNTNFELSQLRIQGARGVALRIHNGAYGEFQGKIINARFGGIWIDSAADDGVLVTDAEISRTREGPGVLLLSGDSTVIENSRISDCRHGGVLATQAAGARLTRVKLLNNGDYQMAAYGNAQILAIGSTYTPAKQSSFASCAEEAQIELVTSDSVNDPRAASTLFCP